MNPGNLWVHGQPPFELRMHWDPRSRKPLWRAGHEPRGEARASADWKSAVQQSGTLRYGEEVHGQPPFDFSHALGPGTAAASWSAPVPWRYSGCAAIESARGLAHSKTLPRFLVPMRVPSTRRLSMNRNESFPFSSSSSRSSGLCAVPGCPLWLDAPAQGVIKSRAYADLRI